MSTTIEITHHAYTQDHTSGSYLYGVVTHIIPKEDPLDDEINTHWMTILNENIKCVVVRSTLLPFTANISA